MGKFSHAVFLYQPEENIVLLFSILKKTISIKIISIKENLVF